MKRIGIISDTHGLWDDRFATYFADCDEVWHGVAIGDYSIIERLQKTVLVVRVRNLVKLTIDGSDMLECEIIELS